MARSIVALGCVLLIHTTTARADQCIVVKPEVAKWAAKVLADQTAIKHCEPCDEKRPSPPFAVKRVETRAWSGDTTQKVVVVNGKEEDLAYLYVQTGPDTYTNVAAMAGCPTTGVSPFYTKQRADAESPTVPYPTDFPRSGIKECDQFIRFYVRCIDEKFPEATKKTARSAIKQAADGWRQAAENEAARTALRDACRQMIDSVRESTKQLQCKWD
jgi:hypothetical protein